MPRTLLVVDDSATMRKVFEITFAGEDIAVFAHDGSESLMAQAREQRPAAAVVDVNLGGPDAYAIVRSLKSDPALGGLPVLLLYSEHSPIDENRARDAGADGSMQKPFDSQAAIDRIKQLLGTARAAAPATAAAPAPAPARSTAVVTPAGAPSAIGAQPARPGAPSAAGVGSFGARPAAPGGGAKATQMFVTPPPAAINSPPAAPPPPPPQRPVAPPPPAPVARAAPPAQQAGPPRKDSVELEVNLGGEEEVSLDAGAHAPAAIPAASAPAAKLSAEVSQRVAAMGLSPAQVEAVTALTREVVERVVWEVIPQLAETLIREEIKRLTAE